MKFIKYEKNYNMKQSNVYIECGFKRNIYNFRKQYLLRWRQHTPQTVVTMNSVRMD